MLLPAQDVRTFFVTTVTASRRRLFQVTANAQLLIDVLKDNQARGRMHVHAYVLMPDHLHLLITPAPDVSLEKAMQYIKGGFSFRLKSKMDVWQKSFNEQRIRDRVDYATHKQYIEQNPLRAGLPDAAKYPYTSALDSAWLSATPTHFE